MTLPIPIDDGACSHLVGTRLPAISLLATNGEWINLSKLQGITVIYIYPMTGRPDIPPPDGWDQIPGAKGCTPQSCSFRDHFGELTKLRAGVYGLSTQPTSYQAEAVERLHLPFSLLSDLNLALCRVLSLPTMRIDGDTLIKRTTLIAKGNMIEKVFYPVFPPDENAAEVISYLSAIGQEQL